MDRLLTVEDLMNRWQLCESTIRNYLRDGVIVKIEGIPQIRFSEDYIRAIEHQLNEKKTWREIILEKEIEKLKTEMQGLREQAAEMNLIAIKMLRGT